MAKIPSFRALLKQVLHLRESPQRTALAFAIGVFIGFSPAYGLHTVMVFFFAWALRLNLLALMAGAFLNNPWTVVPILGATYWVGALLLGRSENPSFNWQDVSFSAIYEQVMPYAVPFSLGGFVLSLLGAALAYPLAYYFVSKYRQSHPLDPIIHNDSPRNL
ncbi:MAG: DUF2062 domain-containing protein [Nitrospiraceae bacterium]